jgi:hypothetical protein
VRVSLLGRGSGGGASPLGGGEAAALAWWGTEPERALLWATSGLSHSGTGTCATSTRSAGASAASACGRSAPRAASRGAGSWRSACQCECGGTDGQTDEGAASLRAHADHGDGACKGSARVHQQGRDQGLPDRQLVLEHIGAREDLASGLTVCVCSLCL